MEEEKMNLRLDMDVQKLETEKLRKWKNKAEGDLDSLKTDYKRVAELEKTLYQYRNRNSVMELRATLEKIEKMKRRVEELEMALQSCEIRIEFLETSEERKKEQLLCLQFDILSVKYELESDPGQELASLLRKIKALS
ncbi:hypothetical protein Golax_022631, partial [Gossypium laxum]|nr:hypothetical protein [Gossypium laxum]